MGLKSPQWCRACAYICFHLAGECQKDVHIESVSSCRKARQKSRCSDRIFLLSSWLFRRGGGLRYGIQGISTAAIITRIGSFFQRELACSSEGTVVPLTFTWCHPWTKGDHARNWLVASRRALICSLVKQFWFSFLFSLDFAQKALPLQYCTLLCKVHYFLEEQSLEGHWGSKSMKFRNNSRTIRCSFFIKA